MDLENRYGYVVLKNFIDYYQLHDDGPLRIPSHTTNQPISIPQCPAVHQSKLCNSPSCPPTTGGGYIHPAIRPHMGPPSVTTNQT